MSAAEKLKALDEAATNAPWPESGFQLLAEVHAGDAPIIAALRNALPRIIAVVELAEDAADHFIDQSAYDHGWPIELKAALAALGEAVP